MEQENKQKYIVYNKINETHDVCTLHLISPHADVPRYIPGQFITVYFPELNTPEGKAYSISSAPSEHMISISVKTMGEFSRRLHTLEAGDTITASLPYGYFYSESVNTPLVLIAGGIGIAPFRSQIIDSVQNSPQRKISLFYSVRELSDIIFKKEFDELSAVNKNFNVYYFITRDRNVQKNNTLHNIYTERISSEKILKNIQNTTETEFLLCGSVSFTRDIWRDLKTHGVSDNQILTEAFFSQ